MGFKRSKNFGYIPSNELLNSMLFPTSGSKENLAASAVTICKFIETIHGLDIQAEMARLSSWTECPLQTTTQAHLKELERIENEIPDNVRSNSKISGEFFISNNFTNPNFRQDTDHVSICQDQNPWLSGCKRETNRTNLDQPIQSIGNTHCLCIRHK